MNYSDLLWVVENHQKCNIMLLIMNASFILCIFETKELYNALKRNSRNPEKET